jgi:hypothetical protein
MQRQRLIRDGPFLGHSLGEMTTLQSTRLKQLMSVYCGGPSTAATLVATKRTASICTTTRPRRDRDKREARSATARSGRRAPNFQPPSWTPQPRLRGRVESTQRSRGFFGGRQTPFWQYPIQPTMLFRHLRKAEGIHPAGRAGPANPDRPSSMSASRHSNQRIGWAFRRGCPGLRCPSP